jgi:hypothetical protein
VRGRLTMKRFIFLILLLVFLTLGCAHSPSPGPSQSPASSAASSQSGLVMAVSGSDAPGPKSIEVSGSDGSTDGRGTLKEGRTEARDEAAPTTDPPETLKSSPESSAQS